MLQSAFLIRSAFNEMDALVKSHFLLASLSRWMWTSLANSSRNLNVHTWASEASVPTTAPMGSLLDFYYLQY